jgi:hypothetical protein
VRLLVVGVIVLTLGMTFAAIWVGGGWDAVRRQARQLVLLTASLTAIALIVLSIGESGTPMLLFAVVASVVSAVAAAALARSMDDPSAVWGRRSMWALSGLFVLLAALGVVLLVT